MSTLTLPVTEVAKALDTNTYGKMLSTWMLASAGTFEGALKCDDMRYLAKSVHGGAHLTPGQIADMHMDGDQMAGFVHWFLDEVPMAVLSAFETGWDDASRQRGADLAALLFSTAATLPEGPFLYIAAFISKPHAWSGSVYRSPDEMQDAERNWEELFAGRVKDLIHSAPEESNPYLRLAGERLEALALLAKDAPGGAKVLKIMHRESEEPLSSYILGVLAESALDGTIKIQSPPPVYSAEAAPSL